MQSSLPPALPSSLAAALDAALQGVSRKDLAVRAQIQSTAYRGGGTSRPLVTGADALAYALARMPATFAACTAVFARLAQAMPEFAPASLLDVGAGPGTASWAAIAAWPGLGAVTMLDHNPALRALAQRLADGGPLAAARIAAGDAETGDGAELVVASYVLAELPEDRAAALALKLWQRAGKALVLVEPGTPAGFGRIRAARAALIEEGGMIAAPCTHDNACPMAGNDWCHFSQRLPRTRDHMVLKDASVPFEDERYSYLAVTRAAPLLRGARILSPPLTEKPGLTFKLCDGDGLRARFVARRDKDAYRRARRRSWGDLL
ncbi:MAG: hypothetical protein BGN85_05535 [Alphaproteobacteria bacterium 64-11]|nr:MAG: hypothetical protein BGN85_05535 [Alphaproteobacteria bacterium 64-11]